MNRNLCDIGLGRNLTDIGIRVHIVLKAVAVGILQGRVGKEGPHLCRIHNHRHGIVAPDMFRLDKLDGVWTVALGSYAGQFNFSARYRDIVLGSLMVIDKAVFVLGVHLDHHGIRGFADTGPQHGHAHAVIGVGDFGPAVDFIEIGNLVAIAIHFLVADAQHIFHAGGHVVVVTVLVVHELHLVSGTHDHAIHVKTANLQRADNGHRRVRSLHDGHEPAGRIAVCRGIREVAQALEAIADFVTHLQGILLEGNLQDVQNFGEGNRLVEIVLARVGLVIPEIGRYTVFADTVRAVSVVHAVVDGNPGRTGRRLGVGLGKVTGPAVIFGSDLECTCRKEYGTRIENQVGQGIQRKPALPELQILGFTGSKGDIGPLVLARPVTYRKFGDNLNIAGRRIGTGIQEQVPDSKGHLPRIGNTGLHADGATRNGLALSHGLGDGLVVVPGYGTRLALRHGVARASRVASVIAHIHHECGARRSVTALDTDTPGVHQGGRPCLAIAHACRSLHRFPFGNGGGLGRPATGSTGQRHRRRHGHSHFQLGQVRHVGVPDRRILGVEQVHLGAVIVAVAVGICHAGVGSDLVHFIYIGKPVAVGIALAVHLDKVDVFHISQIEQETADTRAGLDIHRQLFGIVIVRLEGHLGIGQRHPVKSLKAIARNEQGVRLATTVLREIEGIDSQEPRRVGGVLLEDKIGLAGK